MSKEETTEAERLAYRTAAGIFLDMSEQVSGSVINTIECTFIGSFCYMMGVPVSVYKISKLPFIGSERTAKRYVDTMVEAGALAYNDQGLVVVTEAGIHNSDWFFRKMFEMPALVAQQQPEAAERALANKDLSEVLTIMTHEAANG